MKTLLKKGLGYSAVFLLSFLVGLYASFPYELLAARLLSAAEERLGIRVDVQDLSPWWLIGLAAEGVDIEVPRRRGGDPVAIHLDRVLARLHPIDSMLSGPTVSVEATDAALGTLEATVAVADEAVAVNLDRLALSIGKLPGLWDMLGVGFQGEAAGTASVTLPLRPAGSARSGIDLSKVAGYTDLRIEGAKFGGGMVKGFTLPPIDLGTVPLKLRIEKGTATTDGPLKIEGRDLQAEIDGKIVLRPIFLTSRVDLSLRFKPTEAFWEENKKLAGLAQALLNNAKRSDGWYGYRMTGQLGRPSFRPKRD